MNYLQIAILALIQGAAELLPVSSSAHVILASRLMNPDPSSPDMTFLIVMLHTGTMFAVIAFFWSRWRAVLAASKGEPGGPLRLLMMIVLATAVTGVVGLGLKFVIEKLVFMKLMGHEKAEIEELFKNLPLVAVDLFCAGLLIIFAGRKKTASETLSISPLSAIWIGLVQGLCLPFRGFSRSGATISVGLLRGIQRTRAEDFSFALAIVLTPPVVIRELMRLMNSKDWTGSAELGRMLMPGLVGMALSFGAGLIALRFLSSMLEKGRWKFFGYYCIGFAIVVAVVAAMSS
jgi:undecaprenyl-diphosphatase